MHIRTQLRAAARTALQAALPSVKVSAIRTYARNREGLPAIEITTPTESAELVNYQGGFLRTITLGVLIYQVAGDVEDALDALAETVEETLIADAGVKALVQQLVLDQTSFDPGDGAEGRPARLTITFTAKARP